MIYPNYYTEEYPSGILLKLIHLTMIALKNKWFHFEDTYIK